jgi:uncharacterized protein YggE
MEKPDTVTVVVGQRDEVKADQVDIYVTINGSLLFTGKGALKKAKEVSTLLSTLNEVGIKEDDVVLQSLHVERTTGFLGKNSSATYQIRIRCHDLELLAAILGVVTSQKNANLDYLSWRYPDSQKLKEEWLHSCLSEAKGKAAAIAARLGVELLGIYTLSEKWIDSEQSDSGQSPRFVALASTRARTADLGFPLSHSKWVEIQVETEFRVSALKAATSVS